MPYLISLDFNQITPYYIRVNESGWDEIYDPYQATKFTSSSEAKKWGKENTTFEKYTKVVGSKKAQEKFDEWQNAGMIRRSFSCPNKELNIKYDPKKHSKEDVLNWWIAYYSTEDPDNAVRYEVYETWPDLFTLYEVIRNGNSYCNKDYSEKYISFSFNVNKTTSFETFEQELNLVKDRITLKDDDGNLLINVFDHFLSEHGNSATFIIKCDDSYAMEVCYGEYVEGDLETVFDYWQRERYYE